MSDIRAVGAQLRAAGQKHQDAADYLRTVPDTHPRIQEFLTSMGPLFGDFRAAGLQVLDQRKACYTKQADDHEHVNDGLNQAAASWDNHEDGASQQFRGLVDGAPAAASGGGGGSAVQAVSYLGGSGPGEELIVNPNPVLSDTLPGAAAGSEGMPRIPPEVINPKPGRGL